MVEASMERGAECLYRSHRGMYFALVKVASKQIRGSPRTKDRQMANRLLATFREKTERLQGNAQRDLRFEELCTQWVESICSGLKASSYQRRLSSLNQIKPYFKNEMVRSVNVEKIDQWKSARGKEISSRTCNIHLETLRFRFAFAKDVKRIILDNPVEENRRKKEPKHTRTIHSQEQLTALIAALRAAPRANVPGGAADVMEFLAYSGCRIGEAVKVRWQNVNDELGTMLKRSCRARLFGRHIEARPT